MNNNSENITQEIKKAVHQLVPDAKISLFGSRAGENYTDESDWDILIISDAKIEMEQKSKIRNALYNITLQRGTYFDLVISHKNEWNHTGKYYSLQQTIGNNFKLL